MEEQTWLNLIMVIWRQELNRKQSSERVSTFSIVGDRGRARDDLILIDGVALFIFNACKNFRISECNFRVICDL